MGKLPKMSNYFFIGQKPALAADCNTFLSHLVSAYADVSPVTDVWQWFLRRCVTDAKEKITGCLLSSPTLWPLPGQLMVGYLLCCASSSHSHPHLSLAAVEQHEVDIEASALLNHSMRWGCEKLKGFHFKMWSCDHGSWSMVSFWNEALFSQACLTPEHALSHDTLYLQGEKISIL